MTPDGDPIAADGPERQLDDGAEMLFRQVHPQWIVDGEPSSQAFRPTKKDEGMLSVSLEHLTTAEDAYLHHTETLGLASGGTWGVTVGEVQATGLASFEQPLEDSPAHGFIDFRGVGRGPCEACAKMLRANARDRGCLHDPA